MGMIHPNSAVGIIQGKIGNIVLVKRADGHVVARNRPVRKARLSAAERAAQGRFALAVAYLRSIKADAQLYEPYQRAAARSGQRACDLAIRDFFSPPAIAEIDLSRYTGKAGETILVQAVDVVELRRVEIRIGDASGALIEQGPALLQAGSSSSWLYHSQAEVLPGQVVRIEAKAWDRPGTVVVKTADHLCGPLPPGV